MDLGGTLRALRLENGWTQPEAVQKLSEVGCVCTTKSLSRWERGDTNPTAQQFLSLCRIYAVRDVLEVFCGIPGQTASLNAAGKRRMKEYLRLLAADNEFAAVPHVRQERQLRAIPLYDLPASAGTGQFLDSSDYELIEVDDTVPLSATFAVRISGDSMLPRFVDQQIVYVKQQQTLSVGEIGIFFLNGDAYCKQLGGDHENVALVSLNQKYKPIVIKEDDELRVLGKVVA